MELETRKITAHIEKDLLASAQKVTGKGITDTIKTALECLARAEAYQKLRGLRGKCNIKLDLSESRKDRKFKLKKRKKT